MAKKELVGFLNNVCMFLGFGALILELFILSLLTTRFLYFILALASLIVGNILYKKTKDAPFGFCVAISIFMFIIAIISFLYRSTGFVSIPLLVGMLDNGFGMAFIGYFQLICIPIILLILSIPILTFKNNSARLIDIILIVLSFIFLLRIN